MPTSGYAQATLLNYERELTRLFGEEYSLADSLRFPVFVGTFTQASTGRMKSARDALPAEVRSFIDEFQADLSLDVIEDSRYEFRVHLVQQTGSKSEADVALSFVREDELTDDQRATLTGLGRGGTVIVRERERAVSGAGLLKPTQVVKAVAPQVPFVFNMYHFSQAWKRRGVRPPTDDPHPERTDERYCVYDRPHGDYLYKPAFVDKLVRSCQTATGFRELTGAAPRTVGAPGK